MQAGILDFWKMGKKKSKKRNNLRSPSSQQVRSSVGGHPKYKKQSDKRVSNSGTNATIFEEDLSFGSYVLIGALILLIASPAIVGPYGQKGGYTPDLHMAAYIQVGGMVVLSLFMLSLFVRKQVVISRSPLLLPLLLFYGWAMLSILWADTKYESIIDALDWSGAFLCGLLILLLLRNIKLLNWMLFSLLFSGLLIALLGIGQYLFGIDWVQQHIVPAATFSNKNMAGQYGVLTLPIAVAFFLRYSKPGAIGFFSLVMTLIAVYIFYTRSRGAWIGFLVEMVVLLILLTYIKIKHSYNLFGDMPLKKIALITSLALFLGMAYLTPVMLGNAEKVRKASIGSKPSVLSAQHGGEVFDSVTENFTNSADTRTTMWVNSIPMFLDNFLIGVGLGNWTIHYAKYQSWFKPDKELMQNKYHANAHNDYVEIICELGIIGLVLFVWIIIALFKTFKRLLSYPNKDYFLLTVPMIVAISGIMMNAVFSFPLKQPVPIFLVMIYLAVLSNLYGASVEKGHYYAFSTPPLPVKALLAALVIVATYGVFHLQRDWYNLEFHYRNALVALEKGKFKQAYKQARLAYELSPLRTKLLWLEATALTQFGNKQSYKKAIDLFEKVDRDYPYSSSTISNLVHAYDISGRTEDAARVIGKLFSVQPTNPDVGYKYGAFLFKAGKVEEALKVFEESVYMIRLEDHEWNLEGLKRSKIEGDESYMAYYKEQLKESKKELDYITQLISQIKQQRQKKTAPIGS